MSEKEHSVNEYSTSDILNGLDWCEGPDLCYGHLCPYYHIGNGCISVLHAAAWEALYEHKPVKVETFGKEGYFAFACENCGMDVAPGDRFCRYCGRELSWDEHQALHA